MVRRTRLYNIFFIATTYFIIWKSLFLWHPRRSSIIRLWQAVNAYIHISKLWSPKFEYINTYLWKDRYVRPSVLIEYFILERMFFSRLSNLTLIALRDANMGKRVYLSRNVHYINLIYQLSAMQLRLSHEICLLYYLFRLCCLSFLIICI